jgi:hypothetical protein
MTVAPMLGREAPAGVSLNGASATAVRTDRVRAGQGLGAALLSPAALSIITTAFHGPQRATWSNGSVVCRSWATKAASPKTPAPAIGFPAIAVGTALQIAIYREDRISAPHGPASSDATP